MSINEIVNSDLVVVTISTLFLTTLLCGGVGSNVDVSYLGACDLFGFNFDDETIMNELHGVGVRAELIFADNVLEDLHDERGMGMGRDEGGGSRTTERTAASPMHRPCDAR